MSITRISEFRARAGKSDELRAFLASIVPGIASSPGCQSAQLLQSHDDPARFVVIESWESIEAHQASVTNIPAEALASIMPLLDSPPYGECFNS